MKKILSVVLVLAMLASFAACGNEPYAYVSVALAGEVKAAAVKVTLRDADNDGVITVNDALLSVHKKYAAKGADDYASEEGDYGLYITKLWGDESGSYGYYVNNQSVANLEAEVQSGDYIYAYSYKDTTAWSDVYTFFDTERIICDGSEITVKLSQMSYDASWNTVFSPFESADIYVNGMNLGKTDANGEFTFSANVSGGEGVVVQAASEDLIIVPAVCRLVKK